MTKPKAQSKTAEDQEREAAKKVLKKTLEKLPDNFMDCRDMKHSWVRLQDFRPKELHTEGAQPGQPGRQKVRMSPLVYRQLICTRCGCVRTDTVFLRTFEKLSTTYAYPEDYQLPGVPRGVKSSLVVRQEQYRRAMEHVAHAEPGASEKMTSAAEK